MCRITINCEIVKHRHTNRYAISFLLWYARPVPEHIYVTTCVNATIDCSKVLRLIFDGIGPFWYCENTLIWNSMLFYTPVWKTDVLCRGNVRPSVCPSVRPSVRVFRTFLQHALRYQFETWYIHSVDGTTYRVRLASQLGHFDLVYSQK